MCGPGPAGQQGAIDNVVGLRAEVLGHRHIPRQRRAQQRRQGCDGPADRGLRHPVGLADLGLNAVSPEIRQRDDHGREQSQNRRPGDFLGLRGRLVRSVHAGTQLDNFVSHEACCMIHPGRLVSED